MKDKKLKWLKKQLKEHSSIYRKGYFDEEDEKHLVSLMEKFKKEIAIEEKELKKTD